MKKALSVKKPISGKALARLITVFVFLASTALVVFTVSVFMKTLSSVADTRKIDTTKSAKLAGIDGTMLDALLQFHAERTARRPLDASSLGNPFVNLLRRPAEPAPVTEASPSATAPIPVTNGAAPVQPSS